MIYSFAPASKHLHTKGVHNIKWIHIVIIVYLMQWLDSSNLHSLFHPFRDVVRGHDHHRNVLQLRWFLEWIKQILLINNVFQYLEMLGTKFNITYVNETICGTMKTIFFNLWKNSTLTSIRRSYPVISGIQ